MTNFTGVADVVHRAAVTAASNTDSGAGRVGVVNPEEPAVGEHQIRVAIEACRNGASALTRSRILPVEQDPALGDRCRRSG